MHSWHAGPIPPSRRKRATSRPGVLAGIAWRNAGLSSAKRTPGPPSRRQHLRAPWPFQGIPRDHHGSRGARQIDKDSLAGGGAYRPALRPRTAPSPTNPIPPPETRRMPQVGPWTRRNRGSRQQPTSEPQTEDSGGKPILEDSSKAIPGLIEGRAKGLGRRRLQGRGDSGRRLPRGRAPARPDSGPPSNQRPQSENLFCIPAPLLDNHPGAGESGLSGSPLRRSAPPGLSGPGVQAQAQFQLGRSTPTPHRLAILSWSIRPWKQTNAP